jgi:SAM-dependent methyltransferase
MVSASASFTGPQYYDECLGPLLFEPFAADLAQRLPRQAKGDVLEIACGTGILTRKLRQRLDGARRLVATDVSKLMLDYAREKLGESKGIEWREADAMALPFGDATFDAVVCGFGLMFVPDWQAALVEARRLLRHDGVLLFSVWDRLEENPHVVANIAVLHALFPGDSEMHFTRPYEMHDPALLRRLLEHARFRPAAIETKRVPIDAADPRRIAIGQTRGTPRAALIESRGVSPELVIDQVTEALIKVGGNPYRGHAQAVIVQAQAI